MEAAYTYRATVLRIIDADTYDVEVDVGFRLYTRLPLRLAGVDAPERSDPAHEAALNEVWRVLRSLPAPVVVRTLKPTDSFGRYLAEVYVGEVELGAHLLATGHAVPFHR